MVVVDSWVSDEESGRVAVVGLGDQLWGDLGALDDVNVGGAEVFCYGADEGGEACDRLALGILTREKSEAGGTEIGAGRVCARKVQARQGELGGDSTGYDSDVHGQLLFHVAMFHVKHCE